MATGKTISTGESIDHAHTSAVAEGDILKIGVVIGVAQAAAAANAKTSWSVKGRKLMPKTAGGGTAIAIGTKLYWDNGAAVVTATSAGNTACGYASAASVDADTTQETLLAPVA